MCKLTGDAAAGGTSIVARVEAWFLSYVTFKKPTQPDVASDAFYEYISRRQLHGTSPLARICPRNRMPRQDKTNRKIWHRSHTVDAVDPVWRPGSRLAIAFDGRLAQLPPNSSPLCDQHERVAIRVWRHCDLRPPR